MDKKDLSYEEAVNKLEELLIEIESDDLKLEDTLEKFKEAMELYKYCNTVLTNAEGTVKQILEKDNSLLEIDFPSVFREENNEEY